MDRLTVYVRRIDGTLAGTIDPLSVTALKRFCDVGTWQVSCPLAPGPAAELFQDGSAVVIRDKYGTFLSGPSLTLDHQRSKDAQGLGTITVSGVSDETFLTERLAWPTWNQPVSSQTTAYHDVTGQASSVLRTYTDANAGPSARAERKAAGFVFAPDPFVGPTISGSARFRNLLELLQELAIKGGDLGFGVQRTITGPPTFYIYQPRDLTDLVKLSYRLGNLASTEFSLTAPKATFVVGGGSGDLTQRTFLSAQDADAETRWGRRIESFYDIRNENNATDLQSKVDAELAKLAEVAQVKFEALDTDAVQVRRDYDIGDTISVEIAPDVTVTNVVRELEVKQEGPGPPRYAPRSGDPGATATPAQLIKIREAIAAIRAMQTAQ